MRPPGIDHRFTDMAGSAAGPTAPTLISGPPCRDHTWPGKRAGLADGSSCVDDAVGADL
ncbi:hypothetical protein Ae406Ps2_2262 [Pseudonocardia sp. Ae406_Ps2]|nr:hypothetical protein Ae331Ps2_3662c [Pseudonocardia sp. Ae331_Ps2]OLL99998.1 hypothetical protein Ae331Ps2_3665c [Pseudonocardia sp. Ae331_Ps2]OLM02262.1 hypothetical protein Ae406Ps2_2262 [Pseudonocardia sp. Ae406_Ps2]OLM15394.1 hypothetical protein Ae505Ps2_5526 [Pseudonocardia sp. Ae505_Ps2]OLM23834.1 hypothetical protein Ae706Ps2_2267 [Pseudonocardia sp. Ae706_Ps2]